MKVEQTIQRVSKGPGYHYKVETTRNASVMEEFEIFVPRDQVCYKSTQLSHYQPPNEPHIMPSPVCAKH